LADTPLRLAVLVSGRGSNLQALIDAIAAGRLPATIQGVFSDKRKAYALERARLAGIPAEAVSPRDHPDRLAFDEAMFERVARVQPRLIVLAGYMRLISAEVVERWQGRIINIHPSLLPAYQGLDTHARVLQAGDAEHGASVHFVTPELDGGPVLAQVRMRVEPGDTPDGLAARLLPREHRLMVACVELLARRRVHPTAHGVAVDGRLLDAPLELREDDRLYDRAGFIA
jgi:phosphoribosylglycinamide formyltransferase-1